MLEDVDGCDVMGGKISAAELDNGVLGLLEAIAEVKGVLLIAQDVVHKSPVEETVVLGLLWVSLGILVEGSLSLP